MDDIHSAMKKYCEYLVNVGRPLAVEDFDEDWEPVGPTIRNDLFYLGLVVKDEDGKLSLTDPGKQLARASA